MFASQGVKKRLGLARKRNVDSKMYLSNSTPGTWRSYLAGRFAPHPRVLRTYPVTTFFHKARKKWQFLSSPQSGISFARLIKAEKKFRERGLK